MNKIIIISIFSILSLISTILLHQKSTKSYLEKIKVIGVQEKTVILKNNTIKNKDLTVFKFESNSARYSITPKTVIEISPNRLITGSVRFQPLWKNDLNNFLIADLNIQMFFGDFFISRIDPNRFLFFAINGEATVLYNNINYTIKDNIFFIYETNENSLNLLTLFNTNLDSKEFYQILKQDSNGFFQMDYDSELNDLVINYIKF